MTSMAAAAPTTAATDENQQPQGVATHSFRTDSSATAVSFEANRLQLKPKYKLDWNSSVNVEQSPVSKELADKFSTLSLKDEPRSIPKLNFESASGLGNSDAIEPPVDGSKDTPWLPSILKDQWPDADYRENISNADKLGSVTNFNDSVVIHQDSIGNLNTDEKIPDWKRAAIEAQQQRSPPQPKLKKIFEPLSSLEKIGAKLDVPIIDNDPQQSTIDSSTFNTAFKLFGQHDSFTSNKLNQIIDNIQKSKLQNKPSVVKMIQEELENAPVIHGSPSKSEADDSVNNKTEDYIKNANALFANLKMRGAPIADQAAQNWNNITSTTTTATMESDASSSLDHSWNFTESINAQDGPNGPDMAHVGDPVETANDDDEETFSSLESMPLSERQNHYSFEDQTANETQDQDEMQAIYNKTFPYLQPEDKIFTPKIKNNIRSKPMLIKPEDFKMRFDENRQEWIPNDQQAMAQMQQNDENVAALEAINDLTTFSKKHGARVTSILKQRSSSVLQPRDLNARSEVSFRIPDRSSSSSPHEDDTFSNKSRSRHSTTHADVTNASQIQDISFSESKRKLINVLSDLQPDGDWDDLTELVLDDLDLSNLNDFHRIVPNLTKVDLSNNEIHFLEGLPNMIKSLSISANQLDNLTSFNRFKNLRFLDISANSFDSLANLSGLQNLTCLICSDNMLTSIDGISQLDTLTTLVASRNKIAGPIDFNSFKFTSMQKLDLSENRLVQVTGIESMPELISLKLDENKLTTVTCDVPHRKLKKLCLNMNALQGLDTAKFPHLRALRIDGNDLRDGLINLKKLPYLDELSFKCQSDERLVQHLQDYMGVVRNLDLSGINRFDFTRKMNFHNVNTLVMSAMNLETIPNNFHELLPNVTSLNLNFNKLKHIGALEKLTKLRSLYMVSNNLVDLQELVKSLSGSRHSLRKLDLRLNPINKRFYSYVFSAHETEADLGKDEQDESPDVSAIQLDTIDDIQSFSIHYKYLLDRVYEKESDWIVRDRAHLINLKLKHSNKDPRGSHNHDSSLYMQRLNYESIMLRLCYKLTFFDGKVVDQNDMIDAKIRVQEML